jgi:aspartate/methionine/tyrosine aminotransferase
MQFSRRLDLFGDEVFAALNAKRRELEAQGREVFDLSVGTPDFEPPRHVIEALRKSAEDPPTGSTPCTIRTSYFERSVTTTARALASRASRPRWS